MKDKELTDFALYLKQTLTAMQWANLHRSMKISRNRLTRLFYGQGDWMLDEIAGVAKVLKVDPIDLIQEHGIGTTVLTIQEYNQIAKPHGLEVGLVAHVA